MVAAGSDFFSGTFAVTCRACQFRLCTSGLTDSNQQLFSKQTSCLTDTLFGTNAAPSMQGHLTPQFATTQPLSSAGSPVISSGAVTAPVMAPGQQQQQQLGAQSTVATLPTSALKQVAGDDNPEMVEDKKLQKRVANRKSAQLSRKRKKQFIEELKDENDFLRRKEQILRSIPDLVVVFDSSGKLWFVSESVNRFLDYAAKDLEGTSFWSMLCTESVRLLKAAFMDSLAARVVEEDTAPLGQGFWDVRLKDKDGSEKLVSLNGVVHFAGDRPECVCSIRPHHDITTKKQNGGTNKSTEQVPPGATQKSQKDGTTKPSTRISDSENASSDE